MTLVAYVSNGPIFTITSRATEAAVVVEVDIARNTLTIGQIFTILFPDRGKTERVGLIMFFIALVESGYEIRLLTGTADFGRKLMRRLNRPIAALLSRLPNQYPDDFSRNFEIGVEASRVDFGHIFTRRAAKLLWSSDKKVQTPLNV